MSVEELAQLANELLENRDQYIFKGMENTQRVSFDSDYEVNIHLIFSNTQPKKLGTF